MIGWPALLEEPMTNSMKRCMGPLAALALAACAVPVVTADAPAGDSFATVLSAPASSPSEPGSTRLEGDGRGAGEMGNPDEASTRAAMALDQRLRAAAEPDYVGYRIVRDPSPRFAFQFRRDAAAALGRHSRDPRFVAIDGGLPREELQPLFDEWWARFEPHRILGAGSVMEFDGEVRFDMTIERVGFEALAAQESWIIPERLKLNFPPSPNTRSVDPAVAHQIRVFAREDRKPAVVLQAALSGRLILRDGCFRLQDHGEGGEPLVLFGRDVELRRDAEGHLIVVDPEGRQARVGERVIWSGPRAAHPDDAGLYTLRAACGSDPVVAIGEPESAAVFEARIRGR